jgi:hypothetical protein
LCGGRPIGKFELETSFEKAAGDDAATLEHKFGFCSQKNRLYFQHPLCGWASNARAPRLSQSPMNSRFANGFGAAILTAPANSSWAIGNRVRKQSDSDVSAGELFTHDPGADDQQRQERLSR